jgi:hypothetical protein
LCEAATFALNYLQMHLDRLPLDDPLRGEIEDRVGLGSVPQARGA